jgi:hypothetical protein
MTRAGAAPVSNVVRILANPTGTQNVAVADFKYLSFKLIAH